jgi:glycosyltransferase involved in cell wall biosynthesis
MVVTFRHVIDVILPALNEARALPFVIPTLPEGFRAIVVDNGSTDGTAQIARVLGASVVFEPTRGFGAACHAGLQKSTSEVVCFMDCDASLDGQDLPSLAGPVLAGEAELVLGARRPLIPSAWPYHARLANRVLARVIRRRTGLLVSDVGPMRAARRESLLGLRICDRRFGWPLEMVLLAAAAGWTVAEVPVAYHPRVGRSKVTGTVRGTALAVHDMMRALA